MANAHIHQQVERPDARGAQDRALDVGFRQMQRAHPVPISGVAFEIPGRGFITRGADRVQSLGVAREHRVVGIKHGEGRVGQQPLGRARARQAIKHPRPLWRTLNQPRLGQEPQVPAHPGLALPQRLRKLAHRQFPLAQQRQRPKPGLLARGAKRADHPLRVAPIWRGLG